MLVAERLGQLRTAVAAMAGHDYAVAARAAGDLFRASPGDQDAMLLLGLALGAQGNARVAAAWLDRVARARPERPHPVQDLVALLQSDPASVVRQYRACLAMDPDEPRVVQAFAAFQCEHGAARDAIGLLRPQLAAHPNDTATRRQLGLALAEAGEFADAAAELRIAVSGDPASAETWANLGMMLKIEGQFDAALAAYDQALLIRPDDTQIRVNRAVARLHAGRLRDAWQDETWQLIGPGRSVLRPEKALPPLSRLPDLAGLTVLVVQEEGLGDTLQFLRYLPLLAERGARVVAAVPASLSRLLRSVPGVADVPAGDAAVPEHDFHCSFNALPRAFETSLDTIPAAVPYLAADPVLASHWAARLPAGDVLRVGLVWAGQARPWLPGFRTLDQRRSTNLATLAPLADIPGVRFVSLQKGAAAATASCPFPLWDVTDDIEDFADTAAIIAHLDLVISVDTSVLHLAGAMAKPVFLLDRYDNCWRWLSGREDSPWYPTLRIFRQAHSGQWEPVIARVKQALSAMVSAPRHRLPLYVAPLG